MVLTDLIARSQYRGLFQSIHACYIHHHLQDDNDAWADFCQHQALDRGLEYHCIDIELNPSVQRQQGLEAAAREARYQAFALLQASLDALVVTAHHANDHAETVLLNLVRGSGSQGLSGLYSANHPKWLRRPLISMARAQLEDYARAHNLAFVEDTTNQQLTFNRNYLRHQVMPLLEVRWPQVLSSFLRVGQNMQESVWLEQKLAETQLALLDFSDYWLELSSDALMTLSWIEIKNILRYWLSHKQKVAFVQLSHSHYEWLECYWYESVRAQKTTTGQRLLNDSLELALYQNRLYLKPVVLKPCHLPSGWIRNEQVSPMDVSGKRRKRFFQSHSIPAWERSIWPVFSQGHDFCYLLPLSATLSETFECMSLSTQTARCVTKKCDSISDQTWCQLLGYHL